MQLPPADVLATWPTPNYINPETRGPANTIVNVVFFPLVFTIILLRTYTRLFLSKSFGVDDGLILLAMLPTAAFAVVSVLATLKYQEDRHIWDMQLDDIVLGLKFEIVAQVLFAVATTLTKISMLIFVRRIVVSSSNRGKMDWATRLAIWIIGFNGLLFSAMTIFQCRPPSDYWKLSFTPQPNCLNQRAILLAAGILNTSTDFLVVILPIPVVYSLNLSLRQRTLVIILFAAGFIVCCVGAVRTVFTYIFSHSWDQSWESFPVWLSSELELYSAIICASIPPTKLFFSRYIGKMFGLAMAGSTVPRFTTDDLESRATARGAVGLGSLLNSMSRPAATYEQAGGSENSLVEFHDSKKIDQ